MAGQAGHVAMIPSKKATVLLRFEAVVQNVESGAQPRPQVGHTMQGPEPLDTSHHFSKPKSSFCQLGQHLLTSQGLADIG